jgi:hypothetical protein
MKKLLRNLLCRIGIHSWKYQLLPWRHRECRRCARAQWFYNYKSAWLDYDGFVSIKREGLFK